MNIKLYNLDTIYKLPKVEWLENRKYDKTNKFFNDNEE
ncbi:uncharacterized protein METZ01_LOCUS247611, partial [marine metagenome]